MPRRFARLAVLSVLIACAPQEYHADTPSEYLTAAGCLQSNQDRLHATGLYAGTYLTVGTEEPAVSPWWAGGTTRAHPEWKPNDPYLGRGYEGALTAELADRLGIPDDHVRFVPIALDDVYASGPKDFDFAIGQLPFLPARSNDVDFSDGYLSAADALKAVPRSRLADRLATPGHLAMLFEEGSPFVECVNLALAEMDGDGTLAELRQRWLGAQIDASA